jgi:hypothetical protein
MKNKNFFQLDFQEQIDNQKLFIKQLEGELKNKLQQFHPQATAAQQQQQLQQQQQQQQQQQLTIQQQQHALALQKQKLQYQAALSQQQKAAGISHINFFLRHGPRGQ